MAEPAPLQSVFTDVRFASPAYLNAIRSVEGLEETFRAKGDRRLFLTGGQRHDGLLVANEKPLLNVLGSPGAGKTTFLKRLGLEALLGSDPTNETRRFDHQLIPVFVELRSLEAQTKLVDAITAEFAACGFPDDTNFVLAGLRNGRFLILLDGLDEVRRTALRDVVDGLNTFAQRYRDNRFITSCRTAFYRSFLTSFTDVVLCDWDDDQIQDFVHRWFSPESSRGHTAGDRLWSALHINAPLLELSRTPLLLTFICLVFGATQRLPSNRATLYKRALEILLERWNAEKQIHHEQIAELESDVELEMLTEIGGILYQNGRYFFRKDQLIQLIRDFLRSQVNAPSWLNPSDVISAIEVQQGLLAERATDVYSFSHLTIQEYLAARYFGTGRAPLPLDHLFDEQWREVFVLLSGMSESRNVIGAITDALAQFAMNNANLHALIKWVQEAVQMSGSRGAVSRLSALAIALAITDSASERPPAVLRVVETRCESAATALADADIWNNAKAAIGLLFHGVWRHSQEISTNDFSALLRSIFAGLAPGEFATLASKIGWIDERSPVNSVELYDLYATLCRSLQVPPQWIRWRTVDMEALSTYLYGVNLLLECRRAAIRLTEEEWRAACDLIFGLSPIM
jgi:predicted NACHT family NTPase